MNDDQRKAAIKTAIVPYLTAANYAFKDVIQAAERAVPDVDPLEVAYAFDDLARAMEEESRAVRAELARRRAQP